MPSVGDKVRVMSNNTGRAPREGVVTQATGELLRIRWLTGEETTLIPRSSSITVLGKVRSPSSATTKKGSAGLTRATKANKTSSVKKHSAKSSRSRKS